ncbi:UNVERIFIED_CONTAM: hypothetical protein GTU68_029134 [Idotea baltica]|nr:hypothetical protein [Idotea baltica]
MGDVGPCGPCSEIHVDIRSAAEKEKVPGKDLVNMDHPQVIEIWNLVFMEFNKNSAGELLSLPAKNVDTGMGLERLVVVMQGKESNYDTDLFSPYIDFMEKELGCKYNRSEEESIAIRVVMDHLRAVCFSIADGQMPASNKAGYVIRRILRRASRYGFQFLGQNEPFLFRMVDILDEVYAGIFPEIAAQKEFIKTTIRQEEASFLRTLARGTQLFDDYLEENKEAKDKVIAGEFAFRLFDTFGFPLDLTELMAREKGWTVDLEAYQVQMTAQRKRAQAATEVKAGDWIEVQSMEGLTTFTGYDQSGDEVQIMRHRTSMAKDKAIHQIVLDTTPFYAEGGGQVGDMGWLRKGDTSIRVIDTKKENDLIVHFVKDLPTPLEGSWIAEVDTKRRRLIKANHSATHLLHAALRQVLGTHVEQRGSLVNDKMLRFDFSHHSKVTAEEIAEIEAIANGKVAEGIALEEHREVPIEQAKSMGAMALFGEKYGESVRVIVFDQEYSIELCGGIHVDNTQEIRLIKVVSESSIASGVRRIEAYTSDKALDFLSGKMETMDQALEDLLEKQRKLEKELQKLQQQMVGGLKDDLLKQVKTVNGHTLLTAQVEVPSPNELKSLAFDLLKGMENGILVLGAGFDGKANLIVALSKEVAEAGVFHAGKMIREIAKEVQGGGGGQPHFASAGGKKPAGIPAALAKAGAMVAG